MSKRGEFKKRRFFSFTSCVLLTLSTLLIGISFEVPNVSANENHDVGEINFDMLTGYGRLLMPLKWPNPGSFQTVSHQGTGFIGLVVDQDGYNHTPGSVDIADCFKEADTKYWTQDDFGASSITMAIDSGGVQKSIATMKNLYTTQDANDIQIDQTVWTVENKDWAIFQWNVQNIKSPAADITGFKLALEVDISQTDWGASTTDAGLGGDSGDDVDGFDAGENVYWAQDDAGSGVAMGFGSVIASDPITHYFSKDYKPATYIEYKEYWEDEQWLYDRISAANSVEGDITAGNRTSQVGWTGETIAAGSSRTFTLVIAINNTKNSMINAIKDAQYYYRNVITGFVFTEFSDSGGTHQIEIFNNGRESTPASNFEFSLDGGVSFLTVSPDKDPIPTYEYAVFDVTGGGSIGDQGDTISVYENGMLIDQVAFGQEGLAPDPLPGESVARYYNPNTASYSNQWVHQASGGHTFGAQNDVGVVMPRTRIVINRVMFDPSVPDEGYIELMYTGPIGLSTNITGYRILCNDEYVIPAGPDTTLDYYNNKFYVFTYSDMNPFFTSMDPSADNVYLCLGNRSILDRVGWSGSHTTGFFMSRIPDGNGTNLGYNDATSIAASWFFDQQPVVMLTELYVDSTSARIEVFNPRGGEKLLDSRWSLESSINGPGALPGLWNLGKIPRDGGYDDFTMNPGPVLGGEGDTITLYWDPSSGPILMDQVGFGTHGPAPDPLSGESTARYYNDTQMIYYDNWTREDTPSFGAQNDVIAINQSSWIILNEVMFYPGTIPTGRFFVLINIMPGWNVNVAGYTIVCDAPYLFPSFPITPGGFDGWIYAPDDPDGRPNMVIIKYTDDPTNSTNFFDSIDETGDNIYLYDFNGELADMVGWNNPHTQGMTVRRVPTGNGTYQGHNDITSEAASWVFDTPLAVQVTEISDDQSTSEIEIYNPRYSLINFSSGNYDFENSTGAALTGTWTKPEAGAGEYAVFDVTSPGLDPDSDIIRFYQSGVLIEEIGYGTKGPVPDPLAGESVQRYWNGVYYTNLWGRNWTTGINFGLQNDIPPANLSSFFMLNEVLFNPSNQDDTYVEVFNAYGIAWDISGYKIVCDQEYIIPQGTILDYSVRYFYFFYLMNTSFFDDMDVGGDNIYLYDTNGSFLDMVGWSSAHNVDQSMSRVPNGAGLRNGYNDTSSYIAGWRFNRQPSVRLIKIDTETGRSAIEYGHHGTYIVFNLVITNLQVISDFVTIENFSQEGWTVEIFDETGMFKINFIGLQPNDTIPIVVNITLPAQYPFAIMDNISIVIRSTNSDIIGDTINLNPRILPFLNITKSVSPDQVYMNGTGHDEIATLTLNITGRGAQFAVRKYLDTVFCIDSSGSMDWNDPGNLRIYESQRFVANYFEPIDRACVVDFDEDADLMPPGYPPGRPLYPPGLNLTMDYERVMENLTFIDSAGGTLVSAGLNVSNEELRLNGDPVNRLGNIILITDAQTTIGDEPACLREADIAAARSVVIFTIGLAMVENSSQEILLKEIANRTGGMYFRSPDASYFKYIYENISSYLTDLAVWDNNTLDMDSMIRDVLPDYIDYIPGSFNIPPTYIDPTGKKLDWNLYQMKLGQTISITFWIVSNEPGLLPTNEYLESRAFYMTWDNTTETILFPYTEFEVLPPAPFPPKLHIEAVGNDIRLTWDEPLSPSSDHFYIYRSPTPTGFDFSVPWRNTEVHIDPGDPLPSSPVGLRFSWNDTSASDSTEYYYCIRTVNDMGETSVTSRTVGGWRRTFPQGVSTFSLPLEPLEATPTASFFLGDMGARYIKWMHPTTHEWMKYGDGGTDDTTLEVGQGYEIAFDAQTTYTFVGLPGAQIMWKESAFTGFDYATNAKSLRITGWDLGTGDIDLQWETPAGMDSSCAYNVYYSTTRDGFDDGTATLLNPLPIPYPAITATHSSAAADGVQFYYMIVPLNTTMDEGSSTYSIGIYFASYDAGYDTIAIPLNITQYTGVRTMDWWCDSISDSVGMNYFNEVTQRWYWHSKVMPEGAFDTYLVMTEGYQISTVADTRFTYIGY